jgi:hypothetical protein
MTRPCATGAPFGVPGFPVGVPNPFANALAGELTFAILPNFALFGIEPCLGAPSFTFTTTDMPAPLTGPVLAGVVLNPASSPQFTELVPGVLQYNGPTARFEVSFSVTLQFVTTDAVFGAPGAAGVISALICKNGVAIQSSADTAIMEPITGEEPADSEHTFQGQALVTLNPGDTLNICVAELLNASNNWPPPGAPASPANPTDTVCVYQLSLLAHQA